MSLIRGFFTVGLWTMASRVLGFLRDIVIAATLGAGPVAEAFFVAFTLPNMFRRFFAEGAFNMAFVPMFSKRLETGEDPDGFASDALSAMVGLLVVLVALAMLAMPWLVLAMASGFAGDERFDLAVIFGRIVFPYILFISLAALLSGVLNASGRFVAAAAAPVLLNVLFIGAMGLGAALRWDIGIVLSWTVPLAGIAQMALVWVAARRAGFAIRLHWPRLTPELKRLAVIAGPALLAGGVVQINLIVGRQVASFTEGAIVWLSFADRLYQLPLGVVGVAVGIVLLPDLSRRLAGGDEAGARDAFNRAAEISLALTLPAAVALGVIAMPLISVLFERGAFLHEDSAATALALVIYAAGLPAFVFQKVLQPLYFARENTKAPFRFALVALVVNAVIAVGLMPIIGYLAAALGATVAGWAMVLLLWRGSRGYGNAAALDSRFIDRAWRIAVASLIMGGVLAAVQATLQGWLADPTLRYAALLILVAAGMATYAIVGQVLRAFSIAELRSATRRQR